MILFKKRYELLELSKKYKLPKIYDLLNNIKLATIDNIAYTDGTDIYVQEDVFNEREAKEQFFIICHELLHILYHHTDERYYPRDVYKNFQLLNICQDVVINEYLNKRLKYKVPSGLYIDNFSDILIQKGIIHYPLSYTGILTTPQLYRFVVDRFKSDDEDKQNMLNDLLQQLSDQFSDDLKDKKEEPIQDAVQQKRQEELLNDAIINIKATLKITDDMINQETKDKDKTLIVAGNEDCFEAKTVEPTRIISINEMINFIEQFIGTNAVIKSRHRTYNRPSRRIQLGNDMVAAGYKRQKNVKRIQLYLDVSGSMSIKLVSDLYSSLKKLYRKVEFDFFTFNHNIFPIDIKNTYSIDTGGGTDITKVLNKINDEKQDVAILVTDCEDRFSLKNVNCNLMIYTNDTSFRSDNPNVSLTYFS